MSRRIKFLAIMAAVALPLAVGAGSFCIFQIAAPDNSSFGATDLASYTATPAVTNDTGLASSTDNIVTPYYAKTVTSADLTKVDIANSMTLDVAADTRGANTLTTAPGDGIAGHVIACKNIDVARHEVPNLGLIAIEDPGIVTAIEFTPLKMVSDDAILC